VAGLGADSATARELKPELNEWSSIVKTNSILADIFDVLMSIDASLSTVPHMKKPPRPERYPRPGDKNTETKNIGKGSLALDEMREWLNQKEAQWPDQ